MGNSVSREHRYGGVEGLGGEVGDGGGGFRRRGDGGGGGMAHWIIYACVVKCRVLHVKYFLGVLFVVACGAGIHDNFPDFASFCCCCQLSSYNFFSAVLFFLALRVFSPSYS